ncbi:unnamed protein product [Symbiodinium natans]|uniref:Non-reducing end beta-L-arabinofuranosidase-like GH127 catalytic domain-containing protein n=1 Tax=Symbiodinium natans TaxID=878477 RepID=A0A812U0N5_9DINO|nr:unnamed protein product [Symbiodinium natans]
MAWTRFVVLPLVNVVSSTAEVPCAGLPFHCVPGGQPVPCRPASAFNWPAILELLRSDEAAAVLGASPALLSEVLAAADGAAGGAPCDVAAAAEAKTRLATLQAGGTWLAPRQRRGLVPPPLGAVQPGGWLNETLQRSAEGLAGRLFEFYPPVVDSNFVGGRSSYSSLHEDFPYALNGLVALAAAAGQQRVTALCDEAIERLLAASSGGWLGPDDWPSLVEEPEEAMAERFGQLSGSLWARFPALQALVQYGEWRAKVPGDRGCRAFLAAEAFVLELGRRLDEGRLRLVAWSSARWPELLWALQALRRAKGPRALCGAPAPDGLALRRLAWLARLQGYDWHRWFSNETFPKQALSREEFSLYSHGVNNAVALKFAALWSKEMGDATAEASLFAWRQLQQHHGVASGAFGADEHLAGREPHRGTELCVVVESMRSLEEAYAAMPDRPELADGLEVLAFNALPAAVSDDNWAHQYLTQSNAAYAGIESVEGAEDDEGPRMSKTFGNVGLDATVYGLSPNFPCCTVNFAQGWGKFVALGLWLFEDGGRDLGLSETPILLSAAFAPSVIAVPAPVGGQVELSTAYPFNPEAGGVYKGQSICEPLSDFVLEEDHDAELLD